MIHMLMFLVAFFLLWKSADYFVDSSHSLALHFKLPPILIGATIVAFGTSAPELFVTGFAASLNQPDVVYGNVFGSNLANLFLILGLSMSIATIPFSVNFRQQLLINILCYILFVFVLFTIPITRLLGLILFVLFIIYKFILIKSGRNESGDAPDYPLIKSIFIFCISLLVLIASSRLLVFEAVNLAQLLGISTRFISLFAVAFGTSLPELVTTVRFIKKGHNDIIVGNVFGSNLFNTAFVLPFSWIVAPVLFNLIYFLELGIVLIASILLFCLTKCTKESPKWLGYLFLLIYIAYIFYIYLNSHL